MQNPALRWSDPTPPQLNINRYTVQWFRNSIPAGIQNVNFGGGPYTIHWNDVNSLIILVGGDIVSASIISVDTVNNLSSIPVVSSVLTIPMTVPLPPINITLSLT